MGNSSTKKELVQSTLYDERLQKSNEKLKKLQKLQKLFFNEQNKKQKDQYRKEIDNIEWEFIEETLKEEGKEDAIENLQKYKMNKSKPFFLWKLYFADVFQRENPGFDVVIGNPPYIKEYTNKKAFDGLRNSKYYQGKMDIWYFFGCIGIDVLRKNGLECFIAPNNWVSNSGSSIFRNKIINDTQMALFIDFGNYKVFKAGIQTMVYLIKKIDGNMEYHLKYSRLLNDKINLNQLSQFLYSDKEMDYFEKYDYKFNGKKALNGYIKFFRNEVAIILNKIENQRDITYLTKDEAATGIDVHQDFLNKKNAKTLGREDKIGSGIFLINEDEKYELKFTKNELKLIKPYYTTKELSKYYGNQNNNIWIIYTRFNIKDNINDYPNIKSHLDFYKKIITSDNKPYGLHRARDENFFKGEKIISLRKCSEPTFTYTDYPCYVSLTFYIIKTKRFDLKFLTGLLNSRLIAFWLYYKGKMQGNNFQVDLEPLCNIPLKNEINEETKKVSLLVKKILELKQNDSTDKEINIIVDEINQIIYNIYGLNKEEIDTIQSLKLEGV